MWAVSNRSDRSGLQCTGIESHYCNYMHAFDVDEDTRPSFQSECTNTVVVSVLLSLGTSVGPIVYPNSRPIKSFYGQCTFLFRTRSAIDF